MASKNAKIHGIIHVASVTAAGVGAGLAQAPGSDAPILVSIQAAMIVSIGEMHGVKLTKQAALLIIAELGATMAGRGLSQVLVGWIPIYGNALNASTAAAITEAMGWAADCYFDSNSEAA